MRDFFWGKRLIDLRLGSVIVWVWNCFEELTVELSYRLSKSSGSRTSLTRK